MAKDRCIQTWHPIRNQKHIASFFPYETGASINACTEEKKKVREREREEGCGKKEKKKQYTSRTDLYTRFRTCIPRFPMHERERTRVTLKRNKDQSVILRILRSYAGDGGGGRRSVCDEIDGTEVFIGGGTTHSVEHNTGCTYALINHRLDAPPVSQVNPCKLLNEGPVSLPNSIFQAEVSR